MSKWKVLMQQVDQIKILHYYVHKSHMDNQFYAAQPKRGANLYRNGMDLYNVPLCVFYCLEAPDYLLLLELTHIGNLPDVNIRDYIFLSWPHIPTWSQSIWYYTNLIILYINYMLHFVWYVLICGCPSMRCYKLQFVLYVMNLQNVQICETYNGLQICKTYDI